MRKVLLILLFLSFNAIKIHAVQEFDTSYKSTYEVTELGKTTVTHNITIKNNLANIYTTNYTISIGSNNLREIKAYDSEGTLDSEVTVNENTTTIDLRINDPAIGKDAIKNLTISYINDDVALQNGRIWEINIPKLSNANEINSYTRIIRVPLSFGEPSIEIPASTTDSIIDNENVFVFEGNKNSSITMFFGDYQVFSLDLKYDIYNNTLKPADTEIAIPPDTNYQKIFISSIEPEPKEIKLDDDGNWLAIYPLDASESKNISFKGFAVVHALPFYDIPLFDHENLLSSNNYWETTNENIISLTTQINTPKKIYDYLVDNFVYSYDRVYSNSERLGAVKALSNPSIAICTEFTDSFVTLARSSGIKAREINGFAYTNNPTLRPLSLERDILHAWPEYLDPETNQWIQIDPTWANTTGGVDYFSKLDFNHVTFVKHGVESTYPYPAGAYKDDSTIKQVEVFFADSAPEEIINLTHMVNTNTSNPLRNEKVITIKNLGNSSVSNYYYLADNNEILIDYLPPYSSKEYTISSSFHLNLDSLPINLIIIALLLTTASYLTVYFLKKLRNKNI